MIAERRLSEIASAKAGMKYANAAFKAARVKLERVAHGGSKYAFKAAEADYDRAFKTREMAIDRCQFLGVDWTEGAE